MRRVWAGVVGMVLVGSAVTAVGTPAVAAPAAPVAAAQAAVPVPDPVGTFRPITPYRAVDRAPVGPGQTVSLSVDPAKGALPPGGGYSVAVNLTVVEPTASTWVTLFPHGVNRPNASTTNPRPGDVSAVSAVVPVAADGTVDLFNALGSVKVILDVVGYYPTTATFHSVTPARLLDTRPGEATVDGKSAGTGSVGAGGSVRVPVAGRAGLPSQGVAGVYVTVTAVTPSANTWVTAYPTGVTQPLASNLNPSTGQTLANLAFVPLGTDGSLTLANALGSTHLLLDVVGYVGKTASTFHPLTPTRFLDTRPGESTFDGLAQGQGPLGTSATIRVPVSGRAGIPTSASSVVVNVTGIQRTGNPTFLTLGSTTTGASPAVSNVNPGPNGLAANLALVPLDVNGELAVYNSTASADVLLDVVAWSDAVVRPGVQLVSHTPSGGYPNGATTAPRFSVDGSTVVMLTDATDVAGGSRGLVSVDVGSGAATFLTSARPLGFEPIALSGDGSVVAYTSDTPPTGGASTTYARLYLWSRATKTWTTVPMPAGGLQFGYPAVSGDGRYVAFTLDVEGSNDPYVYVYDRQTGSTTPLLQDSQGHPEMSYETKLSQDGRYAAFLAYVSSRDPSAPANGNLGVYVLDRTTGVVTTVVGSGSSAGDLLTMTADGGMVTFTRWGTPGTSLWRRSTGQVTTLTSTQSAEARLSGDGRYACFPDTGTDGQLYRLDLTTGDRRLVTVTKYGGPLPVSQLAGTDCQLSADGRQAVFASATSALLPGNPTGRSAVYRLDLGAS